MSTLYNINSKKVLFIHIPKTGGSSVGTVLLPYEIPNRDIVGHQGYIECIRFVKPNEVFTVVRDPWDWRSSWYHYLKGDKNASNSGHRFECDNITSQTFGEHIKWLSTESKNNFTTSVYHGIESKVFLKSQSDYIKGCDNITILRFENLKDDFKRYMSTLGLPLELNVHKRKSSNGDYKDVYDDESINLIRDLYYEDIEKFNYEY